MEFGKIAQGISNQLGIDKASITRESRLIEDLKADSLDVVELIMDLEQEYNIEIPNEELPKIHTVGDIADYIGANI